MPREGYRPGLSDTHTVSVWFHHLAFDALRAEGQKTVQQWAGVLARIAAHLRRVAVRSGRYVLAGRGHLRWILAAALRRGVRKPVGRADLTCSHDMTHRPVSLVPRRY